MNDPNGPIFWNGQYHMFYYYNPGVAIWSDMYLSHKADIAGWTGKVSLTLAAGLPILRTRDEM